MKKLPLTTIRRGGTSIRGERSRQGLYLSPDRVESVFLTANIDVFLGIAFSNVTKGDTNLQVHDRSFLYYHIITNLPHVHQARSYRAGINRIIIPQSASLLKADKKINLRRGGGLGLTTSTETTAIIRLSIQETETPPTQINDCTGNQLSPKNASSLQKADKNINKPSSLSRRTSRTTSTKIATVNVDILRTTTPITN